MSLGPREEHLQERVTGRVSFLIGSVDMRNENHSLDLVTWNHCDLTEGWEGEMNFEVVTRGQCGVQGKGFQRIVEANACLEIDKGG